jgi:predicted enzyme related to lactoylglutathione lyase
MSAKPAKFVWYDLMTTDHKAAESFYGSVIGWDAKDSGLPDRPYTILSMGSTMVGGLMPIPPDAAAKGARPSWMGYIGVDDVDAYTERVKAAGGAVSRAPEDIPGVGRFSVVSDLHGATFLLFTGMDQTQTPTDAANAPGRIGWHELHAGDGASAFAFYSGLFGWTKGDVMDMGPMGSYQMFLTGGEFPVGGIMTKMPQTPAPFWLYYFNVDAIDAAIERTKAGGGQVANGPNEVPGGLWVVQCFDPHGAMFAMVAPKR